MSITTKNICQKVVKFSFRHFKYHIQTLYNKESIIVHWYSCKNVIVYSI